VRRKFLSIPGFEYSQTSSHLGYFELVIQPTAEGEYAFPPKFLVWPGKDFMMNAIPNLNKTFTGNIVMKMKGDGISFE
jgi:kynurenine 3-monooxygenase